MLPRTGIARQNLSYLYSEKTIKAYVGNHSIILPYLYNFQTIPLPPPFENLQTLLNASTMKISRNDVKNFYLTCDCPDYSFSAEIHTFSHPIYLPWSIVVLTYSSNENNPHFQSDWNNFGDESFLVKNMLEKEVLNEQLEYQSINPQIISNFSYSPYPEEATSPSSVLSQVTSSNYNSPVSSSSAENSSPSFHASDSSDSESDTLSHSVDSNSPDIPFE